MHVSAYLAAAAAFLVSVILTAWVRCLAVRHRLIDTPNERSSHSTPVPRGGGIAIVVAVSALILVSAILGTVDWPLAVALLGGGVPVALIGFADDRGSVSVRVRLAVHTLAAIWAMHALGGLAPLQAGVRVTDLGLIGNVLGALALIWSLNLFNFMDGIDGIAASEAIFIASGGAVLGLFGATASVPTAALIVAAAAAGFLIWNWPPAKIFMGDVGSGYLGFVIAVLAIASGRDKPAAPFVWLILGGVFFADALVTLLRRLLRGERVYEAHRSHAYQVLSRRWRGHLPVTASVIALNVVVLLPAAWFANANVTQAALITIAVFLVLATFVIVVGRERMNARGQ